MHPIYNPKKGDSEEHGVYCIVFFYRLYIANMERYWQLTRGFLFSGEVSSACKEVVEEQMRSGLSAMTATNFSQGDKA